MTKFVEIISVVDGFRRGGIAHSAVKTVHRIEVFTKEQLEQIKKEPRLSVRFFEVEEKTPQADPANSGEQNEAEAENPGKGNPKPAKTNAKKGK